MKFIYRFEQNKNQELLKTLNDAAYLVEDKLLNTKINDLVISEYNKKYLIKYKSEIRSTLQKYNYILASALSGVSKPLGNIVMIDYGGGSGIISLIAKAAGIGKVLFNDIFEASCVDARILSESLDIHTDDFVCGDILDIKRYLEANKIVPDVLVSCDVLEHIYDLELFFSSLHQLPGKSLNIAMTTHANPLNPLLKHKLMKQQRDVELNDRNAEWGHKERDSLRSYLNIRYEIIKMTFPQLSEPEILMLASCTRGQKEEEIILTVHSYILKKSITSLTHPTNTCDPITGNWTERLLPIPEYKEILNNAGFQVQIQNGYYGHHKPLTTQVAGKLLDLGVSILGKHGIRLSPFFLVEGRKQPKA